MIILKRTKSSIGKKNVEPAENPGTWPPQGSFCFGAARFCPLPNLPENYQQWELSANWEEYDPRVLALGVDILSELCEGYVVLTDIWSNRERKKREIIERYPVRYHKFLKHTQPDANVYAESSQRLCILTDGFHKGHYFAYRDIDSSDQCFFDFYLFNNKSSPQTAKNAWIAATKGEYDMQIWVADGPTTVDIVLNPKTVDLNRVQTVVENVCEKHHVFLFNPPEKD